ncbi:hypothetical protein [Paenibacillus sp. NEAU-GSW1]|uniref:hypothetical protein n=1 Tax=Paenibacillus sp. NEAU-GSW1 TaxID=2682486 RepID=UPI0012E13313|nr:hypothetical protein [Paenibacillus sp. NEAU-GSW1]MUT68101.1 hypothetical protein [Paenibacillus sp. NEAU-GSW1]
MRNLKKLWATLYLLGAAGIGVGCLFGLLYLALSYEIKFFGMNRALTITGIIVLAVMGLIVYLRIGSYIFETNTYIGATFVIIIVSAFMFMPAVQLWTNTMDAISKYRAKPYVQDYIGELNSTFAKEIAPLEFNEKESKSETLGYWSADSNSIRISLQKQDNILSAEDLKKVIKALPPAKYGVRVSIDYERLDDSEYYGKPYISFAINNKKPTDTPPYCSSNDYDHDPCKMLNELFAQQ